MGKQNQTKLKEKLKQSPCSKPPSHKNARILTLEKLTAKEIYSILISSLKNKPTPQSYFENSFPNYTF